MEYFIYFIQGISSGRIKIGLASSCPRDRLKQLQTKNTEELKLVGSIAIRAVTRGQAERVERQFQERFRDSWVWGEVFEPTPALLGLLSVDPHSCHKCPKDSRVLGPWDRRSGNKGKPMSAEQKAKISASIKALHTTGIWKK